MPQPLIIRSMGTYVILKRIKEKIVKKRRFLAPPEIAFSCMKVRMGLFPLKNILFV